MADWLISFFHITDPKLVKNITEQIPYLIDSIPFAIWETVYSTVLATVFAYVIGLPLGVLLVTGAQDGIRPLPRWLMRALNVVVNLLRSVPFLILMVMVMPLSLVILGTSIGTLGTLVPLTVAAAPFVARLVESSLREADKGIIEAARSMGCSTFQIITKVLLPECLPSLLNGFTTAFITILSYGAMAGIIGGGGLGAIAINYGYYRKKTLVMFVAAALLVILVQIFQTVGTHAAARMDKRKESGQKKKKR